MSRKDLSLWRVALQAEVECAKEANPGGSRGRGFNRLNPSEFSFSAMRFERTSDLDPFIAGRETRTCNDYSTLLLPDAETWLAIKSGSTSSPTAGSGNACLGGSSDGIADVT